MIKTDRAFLEWVVILVALEVTKPLGAHVVHVVLAEVVVVDLQAIELHVLLRAARINVRHLTCHLDV